MIVPRGGITRTVVSSRARQCRPRRPAALDWLATLEPGRPFILWLHLFDPHMPYEPPSGFDPEPEDPLERSWAAFDWPRLLRTADANGGDLPAPIFARARSLYRGEVEHADHWLGQFVEAFRRGRWDDTLFVVTADHPEYFDDGVYFDHSHCLSEAALVVPLVLRYAGRGLLARCDDGGDGDGDGDPKSLAFFERPLYFSADLSGPNEVLSRLRSVAGRPTRRIETNRFPVSARSGRWKYLCDRHGERLVDLATDPEEGRDGSALEVERLERFRAALRCWLTEHCVQALPGEERGESQRRLLESLGYS